MSYSDRLRGLSHALVCSYWVNGESCDCHALAKAAAAPLSAPTCGMCYMRNGMHDPRCPSGGCNPSELKKAEVASSPQHPGELFAALTRPIEWPEGPDSDYSDSEEEMACPPTPTQKLSAPCPKCGVDYCKCQLASSPSPTEPFFATDADFRNAVDILYEDWRARPSHEATTDFDEWKVAEIMRLRAVKVTPEQVKYMVSRFLMWRLPESFNPDGGISFKRLFNEHTAYPMKHEPVGTNLFDAVQAEEMIRYLVDGMPLPSPPEENRDE